VGTSQWNERYRITTRHASPATFVHSVLEKCTHVFLGQGTTLRALEPPPPIPGPVTVREDTATPRAWEARHRVNRQDQAGLHPQWAWPREQHLQSAGRRSPCRSITCHSATALHTNYTLRSLHPSPCRFNIWATISALGWGGGWCGNLPQWTEHYRLSTHHGIFNAHWLARRLAAKV
jgi:hypothetical protein